MDKCASKFSEVLLTPEPHYIPGYAGYCPQLKYHVGKSYSKLTAELLTSPEVKRSGRLVLRTGRDDSTETPRITSDGNFKKVIPGYTGFIPKRNNYFACSYTETCRKALAEFHLERSARAQQRAAELTSVPFNQFKDTSSNLDSGLANLPGLESLGHKEDSSSEAVDLSSALIK